MRGLSPPLYLGLASLKTTPRAAEEASFPQLGWLALCAKRGVVLRARALSHPDSYGAETPFPAHSVRLMLASMARALAVGGATGLAVGIVVRVLTDVPFTPEIGLLLGLLIGWGLIARTRMREPR